MTIQELYDSVARLGFETELEEDTRFFLATNRAILQINRIRPATSIYKLNHFSLENLIKENTFEPIRKSGEALIFIANGVKSYYFQCNGNGIATIEKTTDDGTTWSIIKSIDLIGANNQFNEYKGFILDGNDPFDGTIRLKFSGEYTYYVKNVALYSELFSNLLSDIPEYSEYSTYDLASLTNDFLSFEYPPVVDAKMDKSFSLNEDYFIEGTSKILIPASIQYNGIYEIAYQKQPIKVNEEDDKDTTNIDLDNELCALLPNLVASYIWLDDEPEKAQYYLSLYREQVAEISAKIKHFTPVVYRNKNGW